MSTNKDTITISAVGDIMLGDHPHYVGMGIGSRLRKGRLLDPFRNVKTLLKESDIVLGNLETVLSKKSKLRNRFDRINMRGEPSSAKLLSEAGFNVISVANNHAMQHGVKSWYESIDHLRSVGIKVVGIKNNPTLVMKCKGIRVAVLGFSLHPPQYGVLSPPYSLATAGEIEKRVIHTRKEADTIILMLHWGDEYTSWPSPEQVRIGESLIRAGATLIIGHHPHVLQGVEFKENSAVAYSMGNFVSDMVKKRSRETAILSITLSKKGVETLRLVPARIGDDSCPHLLSKKEGKSILELMEKYNSIIPLPKDSQRHIEYEEEVTRTVKEFRQEFLKWLVFNWHKYPLPALLWLISGIVWRRLFWYPFIAGIRFITRTRVN